MRKLIFALLTILTGLVSAQDYITRDGSKLILEGEEILLRGMAFGNLVWDDNYSPTRHHTEKDYARLEALGMNVIRFYLNYRTFENDNDPYSYKASGWAWLDSNIVWAKRHNIYLILNMHVPQGGFQSQCDGDALWEVAENQTRLAALWKEIANRYKNEPQIAGFDLLNEPIPTQSVESWSGLAQRLIDSIRTVDDNHLIITERAIALDCDYGYKDANNNYPQINEENLMYTVHMYEPHSFTHQNLEWAGTGDGGSYPDKSKFTAPSDATYATGDYNNPSITSGTTDWTYYEGSSFQIDADSLIMGRIVFLSNGIDTGSVYFDDFKLIEYDENNAAVDTIYADNPKELDTWWWSENETGETITTTNGHNDNFAVGVTGNTAAASIITTQYNFKLTTGHRYKVSGWMKGVNVPAGASASISAEFYHSPSGAEISVFDYNYLVNQIVSYAQYVEQLDYPVYFGEFGAARNTFEDDKGGERWVADIIHIFDSLGYHFTYHSYKESSFGYYDGWAGPIDTTTVNHKLQNVFLEFFGGNTLSTYDIIETNEFMVYPNPVDTQLHIKPLGTITPEHITIFSSEGRLIKDIKSADMIDVSFLPQGTYILQLHSGDDIYFLRFVRKE